MIEDEARMGLSWGDEDMDEEVLVVVLDGSDDDWVTTCDWVAGTKLLWASIVYSLLCDIGALQDHQHSNYD